MGGGQLTAHSQGEGQGADVMRIDRFVRPNYSGPVPENPQARLLEVAIELFGRDGMSATGTRAIAEAAGVQMSAITYHFGGKEGLYQACARHIGQEMLARITPLLEQLESAGVDTGDAAGARATIIALLSGFVTIMMRDEIAPIARFVVREQMNPTPAFTILFEEVMQPMLQRMGGLLQRIAGGRLGKHELSLRAIALMGQVMCFRFARAALMGITGWKKAGTAETEAVRAVVLAHAKAILTTLEQDTPT
jgi:AcrR family transcriptional regulator